MITKTTYALNIDELRSALYEFLNKDADEQYGPFVELDVLHGIDVARDDSGAITGIEFHTETDQGNCAPD